MGNVPAGVSTGISPDGVRERPAAQPAAAEARLCAFAVVRRVFEEGAYADRALHAEAAGLTGRNRAHAMRLAYGTVQRRRTLDHVLEGFSDRRLATLDAPVLAALRLGAYELLYTGAPAHAAVHEAVELAKAGGHGGERLVNAVLRRTAREGRTVIDRLKDTDPEAAALVHSLPGWVAKLWWDTFGPEEARALMAAVNDPPESAVRANTLVMSAEELRVHLPVPARPVPGLPEALVLEAPFDAHGSPLWRDGAFMPQSRSSMLVARALDPQPGESILDLCAAPGAKTTHLAALSRDGTRIVAVERHPGRAEALRRTCARLQAGSVTVETGDARQPRSAGERFDRVLVDPPCSGLGTLQSRPDLRWRVSPEAVQALVEVQREVLEAAAGAVRPGGLLVYSTCTLSPRENEGQVDAFLAAHPDFGPASQAELASPLTPGDAGWQHPARPSDLLLTPHRHGTDGFYIARLRRNGRTGTGR